MNGSIEKLKQNFEVAKKLQKAYKISNKLISSTLGLYHETIADLINYAEADKSNTILVTKYNSFFTGFNNIGNPSLFLHESIAMYCNKKGITQYELKELLNIPKTTNIKRLGVDNILLLNGMLFFAKQNTSLLIQDIAIKHVHNLTILNKIKEENTTHR